MDSEKVICIGSGVGAAKLYLITEALKGISNTVCAIIGARSKDLIILEDAMSSIPDCVFITTDEGTHARKGFVTEPLETPSTIPYLHNGGTGCQLQLADNPQNPQLASRWRLDK
jgi:hypothetical protein